MKVNWTPELDCAVAFGSGLGLSNRDIAVCLGGGITRNSIIGRRHRIGLIDISEPKASRRRPMKPKKLKPIKALRPAPIRWTPEEDQIIRDTYLRPSK